MSGLSDNEAKNLSVHGLKKHYGKVAAVDDISFDVAAGTLVTLLGPSGCGKTTTGRCVLQLYHPTAGEVFFEGDDVAKLNPIDGKRLGIASGDRIRIVSPTVVVADNCRAANWPYYPQECLEPAETAEL